jgi:cobalt/nickel transport system permease protein
MSSISREPPVAGPPVTTGHPALMDTVDPRVRIVVAVTLSAVLAVAHDLATLAVALLVAMVVAGGTALSLVGVLRRLLPINGFLLILLLLLPISTGETPLVAAGSFSYSLEGLRLAVSIALKANAMMLWIIVLLSTLDMVTMGHALSHLGVPEKLAHLLLFSVRYLNLLQGEYSRLRTAMKMRGFRPRMDRHTYRSYGYLVAMLLLRSLERSERVLAAMKCRGFRGRFYLLDHFAYSRRDVWFGSAAALLVGTLVWLEIR